MRILAGILMLIAILLIPIGGSAQTSQASDVNWTTELGFFGANALLGGVSAGVAAVIRGDPIVEAFALGAGGGGLVYAGKRITVVSRPGAGLVGRQVASVGSSVSGSALLGRGPLDRIALSAGPLRVYVGRAVPGIDMRIDVPAVGSTVWGLLNGASVDVAASLSAGAVVLRSQGREMALPGTIFYDPDANHYRKEYVLAHEQVHIIQYDQSYLTWGAPLEGRLAERFSSLRGPLAHLEFNLPVLAAAGLLGISVWDKHERQPWEREAMYLGRTR